MFIPTWIIPTFLQVLVFCYGYKEHQTTPLFPESADRTLVLPLIPGLHCDLCPLELCQIGNDDGAGNQALYENIHKHVTRGKACKNNLLEGIIKLYILYKNIVMIVHSWKL